MGTTRKSPVQFHSPRPAKLRVLLFVAGAMILAILGIRSASTPLAGAAESSLVEPDQDCQLTLLARQKLLQEPSLAPLNLGVSVRDGVALLWGTVPASAHAQRAENCLRSLQGLLNVVNELRIESTDAPKTRRGCGVPEVGRISIPSNLRGRISNPSYAGRDSERISQPPETPQWTPPGAPMPSLLPSGLGLAASLVSPANPDSPAKRVVGQKASRTQPDLCQGNPSNGFPKEGMGACLTEMIGQLQRNDRRYQSIEVLVRGGLVFLTGPADHSDEIFHFAQAITDLPGLDQVIVNNSGARPKSE
jgi:osmotically-inducible protein OsmY